LNLEGLNNSAIVCINPSVFWKKNGMKLMDNVGRNISTCQEQTL
jgi:hypothetical protein